MQDARCWARFHSKLVVNNYFNYFKNNINFEINVKLTVNQYHFHSHLLIFFPPMYYFLYPFCEAKFLVCSGQLYIYFAGPSARAV